MATQDVRETVNDTNFKTIAEYGAVASNVLMTNMVAHQGAMNDIRVAAVGAIIKGLVESDPVQAISALKMMSGDSTAEKIMNLMSAINAGQQQTKSAQTTPPVTP